MSRMAELTAAGIVEQLYLKSDRSGVVLIVEATDSAAAHEQLGSLPLVRNNVTWFTLTSLIAA
jgi:hypothetical protein